MRKQLLILAAALVLPALANAETYVVCDFENHEIGQSVPLWNRYGAAPAATARVVADPADANNKVLLVDLKEWNDYPEFILPAEYAGTALTESFNTGPRRQHLRPLARRPLLQRHIILYR